MSSFTKEWIVIQHPFLFIFGHWQSLNQSDLSLGSCQARLLMGAAHGPQLFSPAATGRHGHGDRMELPHLAGHLERCEFFSALSPPVLPGLHLAVGKEKSSMPTLQKNDRSCQVFSVG